MNGKCIIIGAGDLTMGELAVKEEDYVIAVDGGLSYCGILVVEPDKIIGDFDSVNEQERKALESLKAQVPELIGFEAVTDRVPYDGLFTTRNGLLVPDMAATAARLQETIYAK